MPTSPGTTLVVSPPTGGCGFVTMLLDVANIQSCGIRFQGSRSSTLAISTLKGTMVVPRGSPIAEIGVKLWQFGKAGEATAEPKGAVVACVASPQVALQGLCLFGRNTSNRGAQLSSSNTADRNIWASMLHPILFHPYRLNVRQHFYSAPGHPQADRPWNVGDSAQGRETFLADCTNKTPVRFLFEGLQTGHKGGAFPT
ncbi:hypothetical protein B0O99DRAFT_603038 [Bisporella sp. PMI_857]|nr:hypothetical protein B0O99DRAFT_603038 [Bisporella sp. PMI_857]